MRNKLITAGLTALGVAALAGMAVTAAGTVSTKPAPAFVNRFQNTATDKVDDKGVDDPSTHDVGDDNGGATATSVGRSTPTTVEDRPRAVTPGTTVTTVDDHGGLRRSTATTVDDQGTTVNTIDDRGGSTATTVDDHGGDRRGSDSGSSGGTSGGRG
jgi:hypothetical protein